MMINTLDLVRPRETKDIEYDNQAIDHWFPEKKIDSLR